MRFGKKLMAVAVATSMIATPVMAGAEKLSVVSAQRDAAPVAKGEAGFMLGFGLIGLISVAAVLSAVLLATGAIGDVSEDENGGDPVSP